MKLNSNSTRQSFVYCVNSRLVFVGGYVLLIYRSGNVLRCFLSTFWRPWSWLDVVTTLVTSTPLLTKRIDSWDPDLKINSSIDLIEFDMLSLLLVHLFTPFMVKTVGQNSNAGWTESRSGAQMGWTWNAVHGICAESNLIFAIFSWAHCRVSAYTAYLSDQNISSYKLYRYNLIELAWRFSIIFITLEGNFHSLDLLHPCPSGGSFRFRDWFCCRSKIGTQWMGENVSKGRKRSHSRSHQVSCTLQNHASTPEA